MKSRIHNTGQRGEKISFGIMSHSGLCRLGLCRIRYSVVQDCVVRVNVARVYVVWDYVVWYAVSVSNFSYCHIIGFIQKKS